MNNNTYDFENKSLIVFVLSMMANILGLLF